MGFITAEKGGVSRAKGGGEKEKECTTECKSRRRRNEKAPWARVHRNTMNPPPFVLYRPGLSEARDVKIVTLLFAIVIPMFAPFLRPGDEQGSKGT